MITRLVNRADSAFWDTDGLPANMWCDSAVEPCFSTISANDDVLVTIIINGEGIGYS